MATDCMIQMRQTAFEKRAPISILALFFASRGSVRGSNAGDQRLDFMATGSVKQGF
jgi:hypothetical protein